MKVMFTVLNFGQTHLVTFTVLGHFWSSYKVKFGHLYFGHVNNPLSFQVIALVTFKPFFTVKCVECFVTERASERRRDDSRYFESLSTRPRWSDDGRQNRWSRRAFHRSQQGNVGCCIFRPAFGVLVEIVLFSIFCAKKLKKHEICIKILQKTRFF